MADNPGTSELHPEIQTSFQPGAPEFTRLIPGLNILNQKRCAGGRPPNEKALAGHWLLHQRVQGSVLIGLEADRSQNINPQEFKAQPRPGQVVGCCWPVGNHLEQLHCILCHSPLAWETQPD